MTELRVMTVEDIPAGLNLCRAAGWNQLYRDWAIFLKSSPEGSRVAVKDGKICGTVTTIRYEQKFSWIGMVLVDPSFRRQGIGLQLLRAAMDMLREEETIKLDATPEGRLLYQQLGFTDEYGLSRMKMHAPVNLPETDAEAMTEADLDSVYRYDQPVFGAVRKDLLNWQFGGAVHFAFVKKMNGQIAGYCMGRRGFNFSHIGPVVADNMQIAIELVSAAFKKCEGEPVIVDVPTSGRAWINWLQSLGFTEQRPFIRMYKGQNAYPGLPEKMFAICGPEFG